MRFTFFLPVRNGGGYFQECVRSILAQTYKDFELVVYDNCSTDGSLEWIRSLRDRRIKIFPSVVSLTIEDNWGRILTGPKKEYMTIVGHDDLFYPYYLEEMFVLIERYPEALLYQTHFHIINAAGRTMRKSLPMPISENGPAFLKARLLYLRDSFGTGYVFRSVDYERVGGVPGYKNLMFADDALWLKLMGTGTMVTSPKPCFSYRIWGRNTSCNLNSVVVMRALSDYVGFLVLKSASDPRIKNILTQYLNSYLVPWFQWAYHVGYAEKAERSLIKSEIENIAIQAEDFLFMGRPAELHAHLESSVYPAFAKYAWAFSRGVRWLRQRMLIRFGHTF